MKDGCDPAAVVNADGNGRLVWRGQVSADVSEIASVNAGQALANRAASKKGARAGRPVRFPGFKTRHKTMFRLRARDTEGLPPRPG